MPSAADGQRLAPRPTSFAPDDLYGEILAPITGGVNGDPLKVGRREKCSECHVDEVDGEPVLIEKRIARTVVDGAGSAGDRRGDEREDDQRSLLDESVVEVAGVVSCRDA